MAGPTHLCKWGWQALSCCVPRRAVLLQARTLYLPAPRLAPPAGEAGAGSVQGLLTSK